MEKLFVCFIYAVVIIFKLVFYAFALTMKRRSKFVKALIRLRKLPLAEQRRQLQLANGRFIKDCCAATRKARYAKVSPSLRKRLKRHRKALHTFVNPRTSLRKKKQVLTQRGGILPFLIPLLVAGISATGSIGAAAAHAAISKS